MGMLNRIFNKRGSVTNWLWVSALLLFCMVNPVKSLAPAGPVNRFYSIPFYFGARAKDWNNTKSYYEDQPTTFFWGYNWNLDYLGNLWIVDKYFHTVYYISKEVKTWNAIFKVAGTEGLPGALNGNIAMAQFNRPSSIASWVNDPQYRKMMDNLILIEMHDKFFEQNADYQTMVLKNDCMKWMNRPMDRVKDCGRIIKATFEPIDFTEEQAATMT